MLCAGFGIPVMAAFNADLGVRLANPWAAVLSLNLVAVILSAVVVATIGLPKLDAVSAMPKIYYLAGAIFVFYIASITYAAPKIGLGNAIFLVLLGQILSAAIIDHLGLWNVTQSPITLKRTLGLIVMSIGIYLAQKQENLAVDIG